MRRWLTVVVAGLLLLLGAGSAWAEGSSSGPLRLSGQAVVVRANPAPKLVFSADATDGSGWRLDVNMAPSGQVLGSDGQPNVALQGTYQLSSPSVPLVSGPATGTLTQTGSGTLQLQSTGTSVTQSGSTPLTATFAVSPAGDLQVTLSGTLPAAPPPPAAQPVNHTFWYIARAAGFTAYGLLTLTVCMGLLVQTKLMDAIVARWQTFDLHQVTALVALGFVALHIFALLGDQYMGYTIPQLFVPFLSAYRPTEVAIGIVALYLFVVVVASFYVRRDIGYQTWRAIHYSTFAVFLLALGHGALAGTDTGAPWARLIYWVTGLIVLLLTIWRINRVAAHDAKAAARTVRVPVESGTTRAAKTRSGKI